MHYSPQARNWQQQQPPGAEQPSHIVYLIGDVGNPNLGKTEPSLQLLQNHLAQNPASTVLFLGDNIYDNGLHPTGHPHRPREEQRLTEQLKILDNHKDRVVFIPGNHDWDDMQKDGLKHVREQEKFVENYLQRGNTFLPDNGCPGPVEVELAPDLAVIVYDSQWWLHTHEKPYGPNSECTAQDEKAFLRKMREMVERNRHRNLVVAAHHPLMSNSKSEGYFSVIEHLFPVSLVKDKWYIPLPVVGSLYPFYRQLGGVEQDIPHPRYRLLRDELYKIFRHHDHLVYASGHDHNLQFHRSGKLSHILSGAGCKTNYVASDNRAEYVQEVKGFARVLYYGNQEVWVEYWIPEGDGHTGRVSYRTRLYTRQPKPEQYCSAGDSQPSGNITLAPAPDARKPPAGFTRWLYGSHYAREWITPVQMPLLNLQKTQGGLTPYATSGTGYQQALRLINEQGEEFEIQSVLRHPLKAVPLSYRESPSLSGRTRKRVALQHPYAPLVASSLQQSAGVLHRKVSLAVLPHTDCLGPYRQDYAGLQGYFQKQAEDYHFEKLEDVPRKVQLFEYESLLDALEQNPENKVDEHTLALARLLDMLMGDWDRHAQQYQWVAEKQANGSLLFKPLPVGRDNAFFSFEGVLPWLIARPWALRSMQHFHYNIKDVKGLNNAARTFDRRFLTSLSREEWKNIAASVQESLTDTELENSLKAMPPEAYEISGELMLTKLKSRRDELQQVAGEYYELLAKYVDIYGSDKAEFFEIERLNKEQTKITMFALDSLGRKTSTLCQRVFHSNETKEIRLYGLGGDDVFHTSGEPSGKILVRLIGGRGLDKVSGSESTERGGNVSVFDEDEDPNVLDFTTQTSVDFSSGELINNPGADRFFYDYLGPKFNYRYNTDDGFMPGIGIIARTYKFRSHPYGSEQRLLYHYGFGNNSGRLFYQGDFKNAIGRYDLFLTAWAYTPYYVFNYFGYGNNSRLSGGRNVADYRMRMKHTYFRALAQKTFATFISIGAGPKFETFSLSRSSGNFSDTNLNLENERFSTHRYVGASGFAQIGIKNNYHNPTRGVLLRAEANLNKQLGINARNYRQYHYQVQYFMSPDLPFQLTFAGRLGGTLTTGSYAFYQAAMLGGGTLPDLQQNLRGFNKTRFIGDRSMFTNLEIRASVLNFRLYVLPTKVGLLTLYDTGRVWATGERSRTWHGSYGGGVWVSVVNRVALSATIARSREGNFINIQNGFFF